MSLKQTIQNYFQLVFRGIWALRDVRVAGQVLFVIVVLLVSWSGVKAITTNYQLQQQIAQLQEQNDVQQLENDNLKLRNDYFKSNQYLELSARQNFGLGAQSETELIVPKQIALSYVVTQPKTSTPKPNAEAPAYQRNIQAWVSFFLHR